jgi:colanic acid biosynthesis glycosyl transferase WcaI
LVNWLQDVYPEIAIHLNVRFLHRPVACLISILRDQSLKAAKANVVVGCQMKARLLSGKFCPDRVDVIHNWADDEVIQPVSYVDNPLRYRWQLENKFVVGYSGNLGRAHEFDTIVRAARQLKDHPRIVFVCIGGGYGFDDLRSKIEQHGLQSTFLFFPYQDRNMLKYSLGVADVHWISLKPELEGFIVPSKFYGVAAAGKPIIAISAENGEIAQLVMQHRCGIVIKPGDVTALVQILCDLADDGGRVAEMGRHARAMLELHFSRRHALQSWRHLLESLAGG